MNMILCKDEIIIVPATTCVYFRFSFTGPLTVNVDSCQLNSLLVKSKFVSEFVGTDKPTKFVSCRFVGWCQLNPSLKGLCHDSAHVWAVTVADCLWTNRKWVRCMRGNLHNSRFIVREAGVFRTFLFHFIYPHNSYLFFGIPQINVATDKNKINNPVLLSNKHLPTCIFT